MIGLTGRLRVLVAVVARVETRAEADVLGRLDLGRTDASHDLKGGAEGSRTLGLYSAIRSPGSDIRTRQGTRVKIPGFLDSATSPCFPGLSLGTRPEAAQPGPP